MSYVVQLVGGVPGMERYPELMEHVGRWLTRYEPANAPLGEQWVWTTADPEQALSFANVEEWLATYMQSIGTRLDGHPDRPLTAYHVAVTPREQ